MHPTPSDLPFTDANGRRRERQAVSTGGREWHLHASRDDGTFERRCSDWQRVERALAALLIAISTLFAPAGLAQERPADTDGIARFLRAADDYTQMHRRLERLLPPLQLNANPATLRSAIDAMATAVRAERRDAVEGDLFNPSVQTTLRDRIENALRSHGFTAADVLAAERAEGIDPGTLGLQVNATFPWAFATAVFPCVLDALPPLPPELKYRIVGRDLVVIDLHAGLIVDILRFALGDDDTSGTLQATRGGHHPDRNARK